MAFLTSIKSRLESFCDDGPKFRIFAGVWAALHALFGIIIILYQIWPWNLWFAFFMWIMTATYACAFKQSWLKTRRYGDYLGLFTIWQAGNIWTGAFITGDYITNDQYSDASYHCAVACATTTLMNSFMLWWHKHLVVPRSEIGVLDSVMGGRSRVKTRWFKAIVVFCAAWVGGASAARLGTGIFGLVSTEGVVGLVTCHVILGLFSDRYRDSAWCTLFTGVWGLVVLVVTGGVIYAAADATKTTALERRFHHWVITMWGINLVFFFLPFTCKFCLLNERLNLNFAQPFGSANLKSTAVTESPSTADLEAQAYGMSRGEYEATIRKLDGEDIFRNDYSAQAENQQERSSYHV